MIARFALAKSLISLSKQEPAFDRLFFSKIVTRDASPEAGSSEHCIANIRKAWKVLFKNGESKHGRQTIREATRLCKDTQLDKDDILSFAQWLQASFDYLAMVRFPSREIIVFAQHVQILLLCLQMTCNIEHVWEIPYTKIWSCLARGLRKRRRQYYEMINNLTSNAMPCFGGKIHALISKGVQYSCISGISACFS